MIDKQMSAETARVTFTLAHSGLNGHAVAVVGDFNDWDPGATAMEGLDGTYTVTLSLECGRRYRFRYRSEDGQWFNDDGADDYEPNDHGGQDSVLDLVSNLASDPAELKVQKPVAADARGGAADPPSTQERLARRPRARAGRRP